MLKLPAIGIFRLTAGAYKSTEADFNRSMVHQGFKYTLADKMCRPGVYHLKKIYVEDCPYEKRPNGEPSTADRYWLIGHLLDTDPIKEQIFTTPLGTMPDVADKLLWHLWTDDIVIELSDNGNVTQWLTPDLEPIESDEVPYLSSK